MRTIAQAKQTARGILAIGAALVALFVTLPMVGCGGGSKSSGGSSVTKARGGFTFAVQWPKKSRVIPIAANSIKVTLQRIVPGPTVQPVPALPLLTHPNVNGLPDDSQSEDRVSRVNANNLELGTYRITVTAYPENDGTGVPLAFATVDKAVVSGTNVPLTMVMDATVTRVEITPTAGPPLFVGKKRQFAVTMFDADNNIVITDSMANDVVVWTSSNESIVTIGTDGLATVAGNGTATIRATYKEPYTPAGAEGTGDFGEATVIGIDAQVPWAKFHGDSQNTGKARFGEPTVGELEWEAPINNSIVFSSPAVDEEGSVYVGAYDGRVHAFTADGSPKWPTPFDPGIADNAFDASPALGPDGTIYIGDYAGNLYAIDRETGTEKWRYDADGEIIGSASVVNDVVYFGSTGPGSTLYAVNAATGAEVWKQNPGTAIQTCPAFSLDDTTLYVGGLNGNLYARDAATGDPVWERATGDDIFSSSPAVGPDGKIYVGNLAGDLYAVFPSDGTVVPGFPVQTGIPIYATPAINVNGNEVTVYFGTYDSESNQFNHRFFAVNGLNGGIVWSLKFDQGITSSAAIGNDGTIYFGCFDGFVYALNPDSSPKWTNTDGSPKPFLVGDSIESSPAIGEDGNIFVGDFNGRFVSLL